MNNFAITSAGLGSALQRSASSLKVAGNDLSESIALITSANAIVQNPEKVGTGLKTVALRIQGISEESGEAIPKLDKLIKQITGVDIMKDENTFKSTYDILLEISKIWDTISQKDQANLLDKLFGKQQANVGAAILSNTRDLVNALESAQNSMGSAAAEQELYMDSINAKVNTFNETVVKFWTNTINSDIIKFFVELGTTIVNVLDSDFVRFIATTALVTAGLYGATVAIKALGKSTLGTAIGVFALDNAGKGLSGTITALWEKASISPFFWVAAATVAIQGLVWVFDKLHVSIEEQKEKVEEAKQAYEETKNEIQKLNSELDATKEKIEELSKIKTPSIIEENELEKLQLTNKELEFRLALLAKEEEFNAKKVADTQTDLYNKQFGKYTLSEKQVNEYIQNAQMTGNNAILLSEERNVSALIAAYKQFSQLKEEALSAGNTDDVEHFSGLLDYIEESLINSEKELLVTKDILSKITEPTKEQKNILDNIISGLELINNVIFPDLLKKEIPTVSPANVDDLADYTQAIEDSQKALDDFQSSAKSLSSVWKTLNDGEQLSMDTMFSLIEKYPEYTQEILDANTNREKALELTNKLWEVEKQRAIEAKQAEADILEGRLKNIQALIAQITLSYSDTLAKIEEKEAIVKALADAQSIIDALRNSKPSNYDKTTSDKKSYTPSTEESALKALYDAQLINLDEYISRLLKLEAEKFSEFKNKSSKQIEEMLRSRNENIAKKASEYLSLSGTIEKLQSDRITLSFAETEDSLKSLDSELSKLGNINTLEEKAQQSEIWKNKLRLVVDEIFRIEQALQNSTLSSSQIQLLENKKTELEILRASLTDDLSQNLTQSNESKLDAIEAVESKIIEIIKKRYEEESKEREKAYNKEKKDLQDSLDAYRDYIQGRIDALDKLNETEDYNKQVQEQSQKILDIQSEIDKYSLAANSGDLDAQNRVTELLKEQTDERNSLAEMQTDRERKLQKQSLQEQLKNYENYTKKQEDLLDEEYNTYRENLEKMTTDVALYTEAQKIMANSTFEELTSMYLTFENNFGSGMSLLGSIIENEFIQKLQTAKTALSELNSLTGGKMQESTNAEIEQAKERIGQLQTLWNQTDNENLRRKYNEEAERLRKKYGLSFADLRGYRARYLHGGIDTVGGLNYLDGKPNAVETIFNATQGKKLFDFVNNLPHSIINVVKPNLQSFSDLAGSGMNNNFVFNVAGNVDKAVANDIVEQVIKRQRIEFNKMGIFK